MKVRCINNTGEFLRTYEYKKLEKEMMGRFGATAYTGYDQLWVGKEYLVMGLITFQTYQAYLIDDSGLICACPCQLFEVVDNKAASSWYFRLIEKDENIYPFVQSILGYSELCSDKKAYENLIVEMEEEYQRIYFRRKIELEKELGKE
ncbi:hypothetical protein [Sphingobacterium bambusae]|uniref:Crp/Fnr family transcriptional regulator n=1 Tax=Sphingobacterium bambusae TaxID=662858 RepID=A0ABW6BEN9_9SPHI|nr:hypothetical protein [Sphingobacterium bambusae]WPL49597.1 hypothetical protein SCB77_03915 [Sphingobacterium bambusae]